MPAPPPNVPALEASNTDNKPLSVREMLVSHRANATCAACHVRMDPLGFSLENFDGVGKWRTKEAGMQIDASAKLPDGTGFEGPAGLKKVRLAHRGEFAETVAERMLVYALGRAIE